MDGMEHARWFERAREYGIRVTKDKGVVEQNRQLFYKAVADSATKRNRFKR